MIAPRRKWRAWKCLPGVGIMVVFPSLSAFMRAVANEGASAAYFAGDIAVEWGDINF